MSSRTSNEGGPSGPLFSFTLQHEVSSQETHAVVVNKLLIKRFVLFFICLINVIFGVSVKIVERK